MAKRKTPETEVDMVTEASRDLTDEEAAAEGLDAPEPRVLTPAEASVKRRRDLREKRARVVPRARPIDPRAEAPRPCPTGAHVRNAHTGTCMNCGRAA